MDRAQKAAEAATQKKAASPDQAWNEAFKVAGLFGLLGIIAFAVAAALAASGDDTPEGGDKTPPPPPRQGG
jgi:hypothetical protein